MGYAVLTPCSGLSAIAVMTKCNLIHVQSPVGMLSSLLTFLIGWLRLNHTCCSFNLVGQGNNSSFSHFL
jgi:hypothetical protein